VNSFLIHEDSARIVVATGFQTKSSNAKTGAMVQIWILNRHENPVAAVKSGADRVICGDCPLRRDPQTGKRGCYVRVEQAPLAIWKAYNAGKYSRLVDLSLFKGRFVRFGAYGEPIHIPFALVRAIVATVGAGNFTGYTHQWRNDLYRNYQQFFMASVGANDYLAAEQMGWRTFVVSARAIEKHVLCPASKEAGHRVNCVDCRLCSGASKQARSIWIPPHGAGKKAASMAA